METPREYYYTYYSYEEWGRGYFGSRGCKCLPEEDVKYFGSFKDKTFKPTHKIILKDDYATRAEALADEIILQEHYKVVENSHFANRAYQTSTKFYYISSCEEASKNAKISGQICYKKGVGIFKQSKEELRINCSKGGRKTYERKVGIHARTPEQMSEDGRKAGKKTKELGVGIFALTEDERRTTSSKTGKMMYENRIGIFSFTKQKLQENGKKTSSQKWKCLETGFITSPGALTNYQRKRGIDTSRRKRIE